MTGITGTDHIDHAPTFDHLAVFASALYRRSHFHSEFSPIFAKIKRQQNPDYTIPSYKYTLSRCPALRTAVGVHLLNGWSRAVESCRYDNRNKCYNINHITVFCKSQTLFFAIFKRVAHLHTQESFCVNTCVQRPAPQALPRQIVHADNQPYRCIAS